MDNLSPYFLPGLLLAIYWIGYTPIIAWKVAALVIGPRYGRLDPDSRVAAIGPRVGAFFFGALVILTVTSAASIRLRDINNHLMQTEDLYGVVIQYLGNILQLSAYVLALFLPIAAFVIQRRKAEELRASAEASSGTLLMLAAAVLVALFRWRKR